MEDPIPTFSYALTELVNRHPELSYVHFVEPPEPTSSTPGQAHDTGSVEVCEKIFYTIGSVTDFDRLAPRFE